MQHGKVVAYTFKQLKSRAYTMLPNTLKCEILGFLLFQACFGVLFHTLRLGE